MYYQGANPETQHRLIDLRSSADIPARWHNTPIENFIQAQNFDYPLHPHAEPQVLISTCIEFRYSLPVPARYAYVIRTAGGRLIGQEFAVGYAISRGVRNILLIAHDDCGMAKVGSPHNAEAISCSLVDQGWSKEKADEFVKHQSLKAAIGDEIDALEEEYHRLKRIFKKIHVAPLFLTLADRHVYLPKWYQDHINRSDGTGHGTTPNDMHVKDDDLHGIV